jgi:hypothetical protein
MPNTLSSNITTATQDQNSQKVNDMKQTTISAEKPSGDEVRVAEVFLVVAPATPPAPPPAPARTLVALVDAPPEPSDSGELPKTASPLPLLECIGGLSLAAGLLLGKRGRPAR